MARQYGQTARSSAFQWFAHRITGTFLIFLLITHFWIQHYDRTTASVTASVVTAEQAERGVLPEYPEEAAAAVRARRMPAPPVERDRAITTGLPAGVAAGQLEGPGDLEPPAETRAVEPYDVLMLRLADPVYAVLWKGFNLLFLLFALHHGFYGLNNILTDYIRNDMVRVAAVALSWTVALALLIVGSYSVIVAGLNYA